MSRRWPAAVTQAAMRRPHTGGVHTRHIEGITVRPLRNGDTATVEAVFASLGPESRAKRFGGAKPRLTERELAALARVDGEHHVLVAYLPGDARPAGIARLARDGTTAEIAFAVADVHQGRGVGSVLTRELVDVARAAGITTFHATVAGDNPRAVSLLTRSAKTLGVSWRGGEREFVVALEAAAPSRDDFDPRKSRRGLDAAA
jgi:GNAT superfamily N-acetyltransferase